jgi:hypothetical protein
MSAPQAFSIQNLGTAPLMINSMSLSGGQVFKITSNQCSTTIAVGGSCSISIVFTPSQAGVASSDSLQISYGNPTSVQTIMLDGYAPQLACAFQLTSTTTSSSAAGGSQTVEVTAPNGCGWTGSSNTSWLTITADGSGAGNGTVAFSVAPNTGPSRQGTFAIAGLTFTVNQAGATIAPMGVSPTGGNETTQTFTLSFVDPAGYADLAVVDIVINNFLNGIGACYVAFAPASASSGSLYLVDDAGDGRYASGSPMALPSSGTLSNSQCTISGTGSSVSTSANTLTLTLAVTFAPGFAGNKIFYTAARSNTQNSGWQALGTWDVPGPAPTGPAVGGVSPARTNTLSQTYTFTFTDTNGWQDLAVLNVLINSAIDGRHACYLAYVPSGSNAGSLFLVDDAGDSGGPFTGFVLPGSGTAQNSQCTVGGAGSSVTATGNTLTLTLPITFTAGFAGNQVFFLAARSNTVSSDWQAVGSVTVP